MRITKPLWEYTRDLHHACEAHEVGASMATGKPPRVWYAAWCKALYIIHSKLDKHCDPILFREVEALNDFLDMGFPLQDSKAAVEYVSQLDTQEKIDGAIYVLTGAHLMGGEIMRRRLEGFPTRHLEWNDRKAALHLLQLYRLRDDIGSEARECFTALLKIMDEIKGKYPNGSES